MGRRRCYGQQLVVHMKKVVSFSAPQLTTEEEKRLSSADLIAKGLRDSLTASGALIHALDPLDYAAHFYAVINDNRYYIMCGYVGDGVRQWMVSVDGKRGLLKRLFGGKPDERGMNLVVEVISKEVSSIYSDVRWYERNDWNTNPDHAYSERP